MMRTVEFLFHVVSGAPGSTRDPESRRAWLEEQLHDLPREFRNQSLWLRILGFRRSREENRWFNFEVVPEEAAA